jgi:Golgi nucleoside diphosphatase
MEGELPIVDQTVATGSQTGTSHRWGDYSSMTIDADGCTFWYVNQYYTTTTTFAWSTRVASLKFNNCTPIVLP